MILHFLMKINAMNMGVYLIGQWVFTIHRQFMTCTITLQVEPQLMEITKMSRSEVEPNSDL